MEIFENLFRKYYQTNDLDILKHRRIRFETDPYWKIWKTQTPFFGILEGVFHRSNGYNVLEMLPKKELIYFTKPAFLLERFKNPDEIISLFEEIYQDNLAKAGKTNPQIGAIMRLRNQNARYLIEIARHILNEFEGNPRNMIEANPQTTRQNLMKLSGYSRKVANMVMNCVFDIPEIAIDVRVFRACEALGLIPSGKFQLFNNKHKEQIEMIIKDQAGKFSIEADFLLFMEGGKNTETETPIDTE